MGARTLRPSLHSQRWVLTSLPACAHLPHLFFRSVLIWPKTVEVRITTKGILHNIISSLKILQELYWYYCLAGPVYCLSVREFCVCIFRKKFDGPRESFVSGKWFRREVECNDNRRLLRDPTFPLTDMYPGEMEHSRHLYTHSCSSVTQNHPELETIPISISCQKDKSNVFVRFMYNNEEEWATLLMRITETHN